LLFALAGLGFAGASTWVHYRILTDPTYVSPCDVSATLSCSHVYLSQYGSVWGVPVAIGGMAWFGLVALIAAFASPVDGRVRSAAVGYVFALSIVGLAAILYLAYASFFVLATGCLLCMGTYVTVIGIFITSATANGTAIGDLPARLGADLAGILREPATLVAALVLLGGTVSVMAFFPREGSSGSTASTPVTDAFTAQFTAAWEQQPRLDLGMAPEGAAVVVVKFVDWQCPTCKAMHESYEPVFAKFEASNPGQVREVIKDFPLSIKCNFTMTRELHPAACEAAVAVRIAREQDRADELIDWLFANQATLTPEIVRAHAEEMLGVANFDERAAEIMPAIQGDIADGQALNISGTPTYFVNGVRAQTATGFLPPQVLELAIQLELEKASGQ